MNNDLKHLQISRELRADIFAGRYKIANRLPSEPQLATRFKVARPTVTRALRDLQAEGLIERRAGSGTYLTSNTKSNPSAHLLGLLIPGLGTTEIFEVICGELAGLTRVKEFNLLWGGSTHHRQGISDSLKNAEEVCQQFIDRQVMGVFFAPFELLPDQHKANWHIADNLRKAGIPVVLMDRDLEPFPIRSNFDLVCIDNLAGGYLLAEHLFKLGYRNIRFVARQFSAPTVDARIAGVREALIRHNLNPEPGWVCLGDPSDTKFVRSLMADKQADALICANDYTAAVLIRSLEAIKLRVPRDIRVVGFDDVKYATLVSPPLTTIHQPCRDFATIAFHAMLERIAEPNLPPRTLTVSPTLVVRESCGAYLQRIPK